MWNDDKGDYRLLRLQLAVNKALTDPTFGPLLQRALNGESFNKKEDAVLECSLPEPKGDHFGEDAHGEWTKDGKPELTCTHCGHSFSTSKEKFVHLKKKMGDHFFNAHRAVKHAVIELGKQASDKDIFISAKRRLYKQYGERAKYLHTQRTKDRMLYFIAKFKSLL